MSWLSQGLNDIGLGGVNTFYNSAIKPALENPIVDVGLGLGAAVLTGGWLVTVLTIFEQTGDLPPVPPATPPSAPVVPPTPPAAP